jgi:hypothetical protein
MTLPKKERVADVLIEGRPAIVEDVLNSLRSYLPTWGEYSEERHRQVGLAVFQALMHDRPGPALPPHEGRARLS